MAVIAICDANILIDYSKSDISIIKKISEYYIQSLNFPFLHLRFSYAIIKNKEIVMIQIFGTLKNFDVKTAQRWFSERRIPVQFVDLKEKELSAGEFESVVQALAREYGSRSEAIEEMIDKKSKDYASIAYLDDEDKAQKLFENQLKLLKQPICRNGKDRATIGLSQKVWETWK